VQVKTEMWLNIESQEIFLYIESLEFLASSSFNWKLFLSH